MTIWARNAVLNDLQTLFDQGVFANLPDGPLLERFASRGGELSERAFGVLVERHGPMVLRVCRNVLKDPHDVEDAFQATFLILIRKAGSIRKRGSCGSWLHGVALRVASGIRTSAARRREHERKRAGEFNISESAALPDDLPGLIDEELGRLRDHDRSPLVLCYLEGHTCEEAARQLGWPVGTVKTRLARGRERLRRQLIRRGIAPSLVVSAGSDFLSPMKVTVPASLQTRVIEVSVRHATQGAINAALPTTIAALVRAESTRELIMRGVGVGVVLLGIRLAFAAAVSLPSKTIEDPTPRAAQPEQPKAKLSPIHARVVDLQGKAVAGVEVLVFQLGKPCFTVNTDRDGRIVLAQPRADEWFSLLARGRNSLAGVTHYPPIPLKGGTAEQPLVLTLMPVTHKVSGTIVDPQGRPIAGVRVVGSGLSLEESNFSVSRRLLEQEDYPLGSCVTDAEGRYSLTVPVRTDVSLAALHPRRVSPRIVILEEDEAIGPITLQPGGGIAGRAIDAVTGAPVAGATLGAQLLDSPNESFGAGGEAVSDAQGKFTMSGLEPGVYNVCLSRVPGRAQATARAVVGVRVRGGEDAPTELKVIDGIPLQGVVIDPTTTLPIADAFVGCGGPANPSPGNSFDIQRSDERGQFRFFVPPGEQSVFLLVMGGSIRSSRLGRTRVSVSQDDKPLPIRLVGPGPAHAPVFVPPLGTVLTTISESKTGRLRQSYPRPKAIEGRTVIGQVLDAERQPLVGATIAVRLITEHSMDTVSTVVSDRQGVFIAKDLPLGEVTMIATRPGRDRGGDSLTEIVPAESKSVDFNFGPDRAPRLPGRPAPPTDEPIPPSLKDRLTFANLDPKGTEFLADGPGGEGDDLNRIAQGIHALDGVFYRVGERLIHLRAGAAPSLPDTVRAIAVGARADKVQILHSARGEVPPGTEVGLYTVRFTDGTFERIPAVYGRELGNWYSVTNQPPVRPTHARIAWTGSNDLTDRNPGIGLKIRLFGFTWKNPHPGRTIATIDVTSTTTESELVLVGFTLERD